MALKRKPEVFAPTDGTIRVVCGLDEAAVGTDYSDPTPWARDLYALAFRRVRISARDVELADATGSEITAKVEVRRALTLGPALEAILDGVPCEILRLEERGRTCWLWLSEIATDGTCELVSTSIAYDERAIPHESETPTTVYVRRASTGRSHVGSAGVDALDATCALRIRRGDYDGQRTVRRGGVTYSVVSAEGHGRWIDLRCRERGADRG